MTVLELWKQILLEYSYTGQGWVAEELGDARYATEMVDGVFVITAATSSPWLCWLQAKLATNASRKATAIAGRSVRVRPGFSRRGRMTGCWRMMRVIIWLGRTRSMSGARWIGFR
jgi:hypothetical protein